MKSKNIEGWGLLSPALIIMAFLGLFPFVYVLRLSLYKYNLFSRTGFTFIGFNNYLKLFTDGNFLGSLYKSVLFVVSTIGIQIPLGLGIAVLLLRNFWGRNLIRTILALPLAMAPVAIGTMWVLITRPGTGPISYWLGTLHIDYDISENAFQAFLTTVVMDVWHWTPFVTLSFMSGLTSVPPEPLEAARVDGANSWQIFRYITFPMLGPVFSTILFIRIMDAFKIYDEIWALTSGGPGTATRYVNLYLVRTTLAQNNYGYGATMSVFLLFITIALCSFLMKVISRSKELLR